ncbi:hypothetical protein B0H14DRAFT_2625917 [Mycena olivaceomarginata]|nr:hypothetical protein B0H14DRAFT_2625917 [Mycena olivaceomarginata]
MPRFSHEDSTKIPYNSSSTGSSKGLVSSISKGFLCSKIMQRLRDAGTVVDHSASQFGAKYRHETPEVPCHQEQVKNRSQRALRSQDAETVARIQVTQPFFEALRRVEMKGERVRAENGKKLFWKGEIDLKFTLSNQATTVRFRPSRIDPSESISPSAAQVDEE